jgi:hypothetical protein
MTEVTSIGGPSRARTLGWRAERRPAPGFAHVLGAVAGAFAVIAMVAFVVAADDESPQVPGIVLSLVLIAAALVLGAWGSGPLRSAGTTALVLTIPLLWLFALFGDGNGGRSDVRGVLLLSLATYAALYLFGWTKGRGIFLGAALVALVYWLGFEVAGTGDNGVFSGTFSSDTAQSASDVNTTSDAAAGVVMMLGIAYLVAGGVLDRRRLAGVATPFLAVGAWAAIVGGVALGATQSVLLAGVVAVLIGAAVGVIGAAGHVRRGTTWFGVLVVFGGLVAVLVDVAPDDEAGVGAIALLIAVVCGALAWWLARALGEPEDGDDRALPPPAPDEATGLRSAA